MPEDKQKTIDIDALLNTKLGTKSRWIPKFLKSWLKKTIHQDRVNNFLSETRNVYGVEWLDCCLKHLDVKLDVKGYDNLPEWDENKLYTLVSNHPLGGADGVALGSIIGHKYDGKFKYLVNDLLMNLPGLAPLCIPINKTGAQSRQFPAMVEAGFKGKTNILMFPAGLCSRKQNGKIVDLEWQKTFISKSIETKRDVIPIYFEGRNSDKFYRIANICKALNLKVNLAMLFLVDEMYKNTHKTFTVTIGKPISWQTFTKEKTKKEWAQEVKKIVYNMK